MSRQTGSRYFYRKGPLYVWRIIEYIKENYDGGVQMVVAFRNALNGPLLGQAEYREHPEKV